jgi:proline iminopeptidase
MALVAALGLAALAAATAGVSSGQEGRVDVDGARLFYRSLGDGPDAIVVHFATGLSPRLDALARGRRLVYFDPRGRGASECAGDCAATLSQGVKDLEALRAALGLRRMDLFGWSVYGLEVAAYALEHPDRVGRLVQAAPVPPRAQPYMDERDTAVRGRFTAEDWKTYQEMAASGATPKARCVEFYRVLLRGLFADPTHIRAEDLAHTCSFENEWPENQARALVPYMSSVAAVDLRPRLGELRCQRLVIHGRKDAFPIEGSREWLGDAKDARLLVLEGADHALPIEETDRVVAAVETFLGGRWPDGVEPPR